MVESTPIMKPFTHDDFVAKARAVHGDLYDYTDSVYQGRLKRVTITCPVHGSWEERAYSHWRGCGCPECRMDDESPDPFLLQAGKVHGTKYAFEDTFDLKHVTMSCPQHGPFTLSATAICKGSGCPPCGLDNKKAHGLRSQEEYVRLATEVHGGKYDYSQTVYERATNIIDIGCPVHGTFRQEANSHLRGHQCGACAGAAVGALTMKDDVAFIAEARAVYGETYSYDKVGYQGARKHVTITCPQHGDFQQMPTNFLRGWGCRECSAKHPGRFSQKACDCLDDLAALDGVHIQHAGNGGEKLIKEVNKKVDGFAEATGEIYEYHGDFWHGNPRIYGRDEVNPFNKRTMGQLYDDTVQREKKLRDAGYEVNVMWEDEDDVATFMTKMASKKDAEETALRQGAHILTCLSFVGE